MQVTSPLYKEIISGDYTTETRLVIGENGRLITSGGENITFGGVRILVSTAGAEDGYDESVLLSVETSAQVFDSNMLEVGSCVSREIDVTMIKPAGNITGLERIALYVRVTDGKRNSEWLPQGVFYLDSMEEDANSDGVWRLLRIHGYDALMFAEQDYPENSKLEWPAKDIEVMYEIAKAIGVFIDMRTIKVMRKLYDVQYSPGYSCREILGFIAAMYAGCFIISEEGELQLVCFWDMPKETRYLTDNAGYVLTFGGDRILA